MYNVLMAAQMVGWKMMEDRICMLISCMILCSATERFNKKNKKIKSPEGTPSIMPMNQ